MTLLLMASLALGLLASALSAGFFWTWSFTVMPGLGATEPATAIEAMRAINAGIGTPGFAFVFFGPAVFALLAGTIAATQGAMWAAGCAFVAFAVYAGGVLAVTFAVNLPLNAALASATVTADGAAALWRDYATRWTLWNHVRAAASGGAMLAVSAAVALAARG